MRFSGKIFTASFLCSSFFMPAGDQSFIGKSPVWMPQSCLSPVYSFTDIYSVEKDRCTLYWRVWMGRDDYTTYTGMQTGFMDDFLVVDELADWVRVADAENCLDNSSGIFIREPIDYGWVEKKNLILWHEALYSGTTGCRIKLIPVNPLYPGYSPIYLYGSPDSRVPSDSINTSEFPLYLVKMVGDRYLVSNSIEWRRKENILGWADTKCFTVWDTQITLEPNSDSLAIFERQRMGIRISVFGTEREASKYQKSGKSNYPIWETENSKMFFSTYFMRLPVLEHKGPIIKTVVVADVIPGRTEQEATHIPDSVEIINAKELNSVSPPIDSNYLVYGYTVSRVEGTVYPLYNYVLFMDEDELFKLIKSLDRLYITGQTGTGRRERSREAWYRLLQDNYGTRVEDIQSISLAGLTEIFTGLPSESELLRKYKVDDITNGSVMTDAEFDRICMYIKEKRDRLMTAPGNSKYLFLNHDHPYYWIPASLLP